MYILSDQLKKRPTIITSKPAKGTYWDVTHSCSRKLESKRRRFYQSRVLSIQDSGGASSRSACSTSFLVLESVDEPLWLDGHDIQAGGNGSIFVRKSRAV